MDIPSNQKLDCFPAQRVERQHRIQVERQHRIQKALDGERGADQQRIASIGIDWIDLMLRKNMDYGSSIFQVPILAPETDPATAIRVRMSDKISRLNTLLKQPAEVAESIDDTIRDLGVYCLLWLAAPKK